MVEVPTWEYLIVQPPRSPHSDEFRERLNVLGLNGWELVTVDNGYAFFKRPVEPPHKSLK